MTTVRDMMSTEHSDEKVGILLSAHYKVIK